MTGTNAPLLLRAALGLFLTGSLAGCAPSETGGGAEERTPPATSAAPTVEVEEDRRELPGGGEVSLDAQWQSLGGGGSSGGGGGGSTGDDGGDDDGSSGGGDGEDSYDDFCDAPLGDCAYYIVKTDIGFDMTAAESGASAEIGTSGILGAQADAFTIIENTCTGLEVSGGTATCSITVALVAQEPGLYRAQLAIDIPSHDVTETVELVQEVRAPATALPTEPTDGTASAEPTAESTASSEPLEPVPPEATAPATIDPTVPPAPGPPAPQAPAAAVPTEEP